MPAIEELAKQIESLSPQERKRLLELTPSLSAKLGVDDEWTSLSEEVLSKTWDNAEDAVYDRWREIYGLPTG